MGKAAQMRGFHFLRKRGPPQKGVPGGANRRSKGTAGWKSGACAGVGQPPLRWGGGEKSGVLLRAAGLRGMGCSLEVREPGFLS